MREQARRQGGGSLGSDDPRTEEGDRLGFGLECHT